MAQLKYYWLISVAMFLLFSICLNNAEGPPDPGYYPSTKIGSLGFNQGFRNLWGPQHQTLDQAGTLSILLDNITGGSGFKSLQLYRSLYSGASIKLQPGYTAGVVTCLFLSSTEDPNHTDHDEIDIEFLGTTPDKPYTLQTNLYLNGSGGGQNIGREVRFHLWFDPTQDFHHYAILWTPNDVIVFVDDVPIKRYPLIPHMPMYVYGAIWDGSAWATENGKYKANYTYQPFVSKYKDFKISGCDVNAAASCSPISGFPAGSTRLSSQQTAAMIWVDNNNKMYDYCNDPQKDHTFLPEC